MLTLETLFDEQFYLAQNQEVEEAIAEGLFQTAFEHFSRYGQFEGRHPNPIFDSEYYLAQNPHIQSEVEEGITTVAAHFVNIGQTDNRSPNPFFDPVFYLQQNPTVSQGVANGEFTAFEHFLKIGQFQGLDPSESFNTEFYRDRNFDAVEGIEEEIIGSLFEHFYRFGLELGRLGAPPQLIDDLSNAIALDTLLGSRTIVNSVTDDKPVDIYEFIIPNNASEFSLFMHGLKADANVDLIQDFKQNQAIQPDDIIASSNNPALATESIDIDVLNSGTYFVRVSQFQGETIYALELSAIPLDI
ncbi:MAG: pre-peptidase C-terminal domain-containing protein [Arthrospira sp. SH-MAG29]|nr:calcium-binding protein [Arthrospira sp. SH-MAG29]MBS0016537.1 pre-peptidase C-terminal domain-containing protein [Arthrospira sp. SH-MAG29]